MVVYTATSKLLSLSLKSWPGNKEILVEININHRNKSKILLFGVSSAVNITQGNAVPFCIEKCLKCRTELEVCFFFFKEYVLLKSFLRNKLYLTFVWYYAGIILISSLHQIVKGILLQNWSEITQASVGDQRFTRYKDWHRYLDTCSCDIFRNGSLLSTWIHARHVKWFYIIKWINRSWEWYTHVS